MQAKSFKSLHGRKASLLFCPFFSFHSACAFLSEGLWRETDMDLIAQITLKSNDSSSCFIISKWHYMTEILHSLMILHGNPLSCHSFIHSGRIKAPLFTCTSYWEYLITDIWMESKLTSPLQTSPLLDCFGYHSRSIHHLSTSSSL